MLKGLLSNFLVTTRSKKNPTVIWLYISPELAENRNCRMQLAGPNTHKDNVITFQKNSSMGFFVGSIILSAFSDLLLFFSPSRFHSRA